MTVTITLPAEAWAKIETYLRALQDGNSHKDGIPGVTSAKHHAEIGNLLTQLRPHSRESDEETIRRNLLIWGSASCP